MCESNVSKCGSETVTLIVTRVAHKTLTRPKLTYGNECWPL